MALISTYGKSKEQISAEMTAATEKYYRVEAQVRAEMEAEEKRREMEGEGGAHRKEVEE